MSWDQVFVWMASAFDGPFMVLLILLAGLTLALWVAQSRGRLDLARMFQDDAGKESGLRFAILGSWIISSWVVMADQVSQKQGDPMLLGIYLAVWSGTPIASKIIDKWSGGKAP